MKKLTVITALALLVAPASASAACPAVGRITVDVEGQSLSAEVRARSDEARGALFTFEIWRGGTLEYRESARDRFIPENTLSMWYQQTLPRSWAGSRLVVKAIVRSGECRTVRVKAVNA